MRSNLETAQIPKTVHWDFFKKLPPLESWKHLIHN